MIDPEGESLFWRGMDNKEMLAAIKWAIRNKNEEMAESGKYWFKRFRLPAIINPLGYESW